MKTLKYRPEIDGLRAISIVSVLFFHLDITIFNNIFFKGGYFGVDVFFVISGYLISSIILNEIKHSKFSVLNFFERRIRRLFPTTIIVLLFSTVFSYFYLIPNKLQNFSLEAISALFFYSNIYLHFSGLAYGIKQSFSSPVIHFWSLSVEEQFYLFFPFFCILVTKFFKQFLNLILIIIWIASFLLSLYMSENHPSASFYFLPTRAWEIVTGILIYILINNNRNTPFYKIIYINYVTLLAFLILICSIFFIDDKIKHPHFFTLIPVFSSAILIFGMTFEGCMVKRLLKNKLLVYIGLISFSLYLFHYPIIVFSELEFSEVSIINKMILLILTFMCSIINFIFVEKPFRNRLIFKTKVFFTIIFLSVTFMFAMFILILKYNGFPERYPNGIAKHLEKNTISPWNILKNKNGDSCHGKFCEFININTDKNLFLLGDSHMSVLAPKIYSEFNNEYNIYSLTKGCFVIPEFNKVKNDGNIDFQSGCVSESIIKYDDILKTKKPGIVIFNARLPLYLSTKYFDNQEGVLEETGEDQINIKHFRNEISLFNGYKKYFEDLLNIGHKIILVYPIPETGFVPIKRYIDHYNDFWKTKLSYDLEISKLLSTSYKVYVDRTRLSFKLLNSLKSPNVKRVYPSELFCNTAILGRCITYEKDELLYFDDDHLSELGASKIIEEIIKKINL